MGIITLLTDFGLKDEYVGVMKGAILSTASDATIVDISHGIEAQDIAAAAQILKASYAYFPEGTIHVAVVDPGVGTQRSIIAARCDGYLFLAPNNGLLSPILDSGASVSVHGVDNEILFLHPVSRTFHGRDIFAPVAGHLSMGMPLTSIGPPMSLDQILPLEEEQTQLQPPQPLNQDQFSKEQINQEQIYQDQANQDQVIQEQTNRGQIEGQITTVDRFGNLITNIRVEDLTHLGADQLTITAGDHTIDGMVESYAQIDTEGPVALIGSRDCIEIAINFGNASHALNLGKGDIVRVKANPKY